MMHDFRNISSFLLLLGWSLGQTLHAQTFEYDDAGRLLTIRYADGKGVAYAHDDSGNLLSVSPLSLPPAPSNLQVARGSESGQYLTWVDASETEDEFVVQRRQNGFYAWETLATLPANTATYSDSPPASDFSFRYRVYAVSNADGRSAYSNEADMARDQNRYFNGGSELGEGWIQDETFGLLYTARFPWVYSPEQGWSYLEGEDDESIFIYDFQLGWIWTRKTFWPYVYQFSEQRFLFYGGTEETIRYFYDFESRTYLEIPLSLR